MHSRRIAFGFFSKKFFLKSDQLIYPISSFTFNLLFRIAADFFSN